MEREKYYKCPDCGEHGVTYYPNAEWYMCFECMDYSVPKWQFEETKEFKQYERE